MLSEDSPVRWLWNPSTKDSCPQPLNILYHRTKRKSTLKKWKLNRRNILKRIRLEMAEDKKKEGESPSLVYIFIVPTSYHS